MKSDEKPIFNGAYLERYRKGELSPEEAYALEKASLDDPLLAEALQGYQAAPRSSEPELSFLKQWVNERVEENQAAIRYIPTKRSFAPLLRVAAVFLALVGSAWMAYVFWLQPDRNVLADRGNQPTINKTSTSVQTETGNDQKSNQETPLHSEPVKTDPASVKQDEVKETPLVQADPVKVKTPEISPVELADNDLNRSIINPTPSPSKDEVVRQTEDVTESIQAKSLRKQSEISASPSSKIANNDNDDNPAPTIGWPAYESYLTRNREAAPSPSNTQINHVVVLIFEVDKDGRPKNIKVKQSAGIPYDEKAQDLLKKGPGWIPGKINSRCELQVQF